MEDVRDETCEMHKRHRPFGLQCDHVRTEGTDDQIHLIGCFENPALYGLLKGNAHFHFDSCFHSCLKVFKQMSIVD